MQGTAAPPPPPPPRPASLPIAPFRWAAIAIGVLVTAPELTATSYADWSAIAVLVAYALFRTFRPIRHDAGRMTTVALLLDAAITAEVVLLTGIWASPFTFSLVPSVLQAGFVRGTRFALQLTGLVVACISFAHITTVDRWEEGLRDAAAWTAVLVLVSVLAGSARRLSTESARQQSTAADRVSRLAEANALLYSLNRVARTLPASLDLDVVLDSSIARLRDLMDFDAITVLLYEEADGTWAPVRTASGAVSLPRRPAALQPVLHRAIAADRALLERSPHDGVAPGSTSGIYACLRARTAMVGLLAIESQEPDAFGERELELVNGLVEPLGVALDNARLFARLREIGADEERNRIARELHDRIGQSLASLGFALDHARRVAGRGDDVVPVLDDLREQVRESVREVRDALYELRTEVTETQHLGDLLPVFCDRVRERSGLGVTYHREGSGNLPLLQERELWHIAREAVRNAERHAGGTRLEVRWSCDGEVAYLVVADDGTGFRLAAVPDGSYGLTGMRERATMIGALLEVDSTDGRGTTVRVRVEPDR